MSEYDANLVRSARQGDIDAFSLLVERHWARLVAFARSMVGEAEAEDMVQDSFMIAWRKLGGLRAPGSFLPWMTRILARACFRHAKQSRNHVGLEAVAEPQDPIAAGSLEAVHVQQMLAALAPGQRAVMHCTVVEGMSDSEIGAALGITAGSVRSHRRRARERLRKLFPGSAFSSGQVPVPTER